MGHHQFEGKMLAPRDANVKARTDIIESREPGAERENSASAVAICGESFFICAQCIGARIRRGLRSVPLSRGRRPAAFRADHGFPLLRDRTKKWQDAIHLSAAGGANLRPLLISPRRLGALLVFATTY